MRRSIPPWGIDLAAFALGIALAVWNGWRTADLVWSLWLSSLVLGWIGIAVGVLRTPPAENADGTTVLMTKLFVLGFFTVHFGIFHFVHSIFLSGLFPLETDSWGRGGMRLEYGRVFADYWPWLLAAAIAERRMLTGSTVLAQTAAAAGKGVTIQGVPHPRSMPMGAYKNVVRMHLLIFALLPMKFAGIADGWSYALVYTVYFWPRWGPRAVPS